MKIIILVSSRFTNRDNDRFGTKILKEMGYEVEVWDMTPLVFPGMFKKFTPPDLNSSGDVLCRLMLGKTDYKRALSEVPIGTLFFSFIIYNKDTTWLYKMISKQKHNFVLFYLNVIPSYRGKYSKAPLHVFKSIVTKLKKLLLNGVKSCKWFRFKLMNRLGKNPMPIIVFLGGLRSIDVVQCPMGDRTKRVWVHSLDYDLYLKSLENCMSSGRSRYAVFLDGYWPFHPDYLSLGVDSPVDPTTYYRKVNVFFDEIERKTGLHIIIAAHPRSNYGNLPRYYANREVIAGQTVSLIKDAELILAHYSTSLGIAALFEKPIVLFTMNELENYEMDARYIRAYSEALGKSFINIDSNKKIDLNYELRIDKMAYKQYVENYIKIDGTNKALFWEVVACEITDYFENVQSRRS